MDSSLFKLHLLYDANSHLDQYLNDSTIKAIPFHLPYYCYKNIVPVAKTISKIAFAIARYRINLIYLNDAIDFKFILPLIQLLRLYRIPVIVHLHIDEDDVTLKWMKINAVDRLLFPSNATMQAILNHSPWVDSKKCFCIHNAVDTAVYQPVDTSFLRQELGLNDNFPIIGIVGRLTEIKGQHVFLEMVSKLKAKNINAHYLIVGSDSQQGTYLSFLQARADDLGVQDEVRFLGYRKNIPQLMSLLDLIIVPSMREPFGRVVIEAMACATPVVAAAVGGMVEIFKDGEGGLFFPVNDVDALVAKALYFFHNPEWWEKQKAIAYQVVLNQFTQNIHTSKIEQHMLSLLDR